MSEGKTLYISDLDGTLLNRSAALSEYTKNTLNIMISNGLNFSIATARTSASVSIIMEGVKLTFPIILMNGVLIYSTDQKRYVKINSLADESVSAIIAVLKTMNITGLMYELKDNELMTYYESLENKPIRDFVDERKTRYYKTFRHVDDFADISPENIIYFTIVDTLARIKPVHDELIKLPGINLTMYKDNYTDHLWYLEIFSAEASKETAVKFLRDMYGFERIVGFGDNRNDLPLFKACNTRIAVKNAIKEVKADADYICSANDSDGVVKWLEENVQ